MALSYTLRLLCLALFSQALIQLCGELLLWACAPFLLRRLAFCSLRQRERLLCAAPILPFVVAVLTTVFVCVPQYARGESNHAPEEVGWLCLLLTCAAAGRAMVCAWRGLCVVARTVRLTRACKHLGTPLDGPSDPVPAVLLPSASGVALLGLLRPVILVSQDLAISRAALDVVLDHERAHARQRDNWKLLILRIVPMLPMRLASGQSWFGLWMCAAELAADHDAAAGSPARACLLAESLVTVARSSPMTTGVLQTAFACAERELLDRVESLLHPRAVVPSHNRFLMLAGLGGGLATVLLCLPSSCLHTLAEHLLHLG